MIPTIPTEQMTPEQIARFFAVSASSQRLIVKFTYSRAGVMITDRIVHRDAIPENFKEEKHWQIKVFDIWFPQFSEQVRQGKVTKKKKSVGEGQYATVQATDCMEPIICQTFDNWETAVKHFEQNRPLYLPRIVDDRHIIHRVFAGIDYQLLLEPSGAYHLYFLVG